MSAFSFSRSKKKMKHNILRLHETRGSHSRKCAACSAKNSKLHDEFIPKRRPRRTDKKRAKNKFDHLQMLSNFQCQPLRSQESQTLLRNYRSDCRQTHIEYKAILKGPESETAETDICLDEEFNYQIQHMIENLRKGDVIHAMIEIAELLSHPNLSQRHYAHFLLLKAEALRISEDFTEALECVDESLGHVPDQTCAYYIKGLCLMGIRKWENAIREFHNALWIPSCYTSQAHSCIALCYLRNDMEIEFALAHAKNAVEEDYFDPFCLLVLARVYDRIGSFQKASLVFAELGFSDEQFCAEYENSANNYFENGDLQKAHDMYFDLLRMKPNDERIYHSWKDIENNLST